MDAIKTKGSTVAQLDAQEKLVVNGMEFVSISDEEERTYWVPTGQPNPALAQVTIYNPTWLFVRPSGSHLVIDAENFTHYIPSSFVHLRWHNKAGKERANF
jgi:hypothetical protein